MKEFGTRSELNQQADNLEAEIKEQKALFRKLDAEKRSDSRIEKKVFNKFVESHEEKEGLKKVNRRNESSLH